MLTYDDQSIIGEEKKRILVVEDDIQMSKFIQFKLDNLGYEVAGDAINCEQALQRAEQLQPNLILMDILLEGSDDGIKTAEKIIEKQQVPIIYLTASEDDLLFERAKITEPFGYLIKPFNDRDLRIVLETAFYRHKQNQLIREALRDVRNIINSSIDIMITYDLEGHIIEFNKTAEEAFGLKRRQATRHLITDLCHDEESGSVLLDGDPAAVYRHDKVTFVNSQGKTFRKEIVISPLCRTENELQGRLLVVRGETL
jgi:PAS domain S-box-containing protein